MPELQEIADLTAHRAAVEGRRRDAAILLDDLAVEQAKADADVEQVKTRRERDRARLDGGQVGAKDLERLQHELISLERRISDLEDIEIEVMERIESAQGTFDDLSEQVTAADQRLFALADTRDAHAEEIDASVHAAAAERASAVGGMPEALMALYERLRGQKGVGAAEIRARQCGGCQLSLDAAELGAIRAAPADEVVRHEECGRILVRTAESGL